MTDSPLKSTLKTRKTNFFFGANLWWSMGCEIAQRLPNCLKDSYLRLLKIIEKVLDFSYLVCYIVCMIKIENNKNFKGWLNIFVGGFLFDQAKTQAKAIKIANDLCKTRGENGFSLHGFPMMKGEK